MCGIAGIMGLSAGREIPGDAISRMVQAQVHRGPDGEGFFVDDWISLGHNRLSIIDLEGGDQPICNERGNLWIVYNGEIFNYVELKKDLLARGHRFATSTDTEVILHLYEDKGESCLEELNGQFAFAIWNSESRELFLARDRMGILPLHYSAQDGCFLFASEIKALFASGLVGRCLDPVALDQIFTFWTTIGGRTAFKGVHELPAGHFLRVSRETVRLQRYWGFPCLPETEQLRSSPERLAEDVAGLTLDAVRIRLRADVPVGCYISGGLDSSGITALVKNRFDNEVRSFGIQFEDANFDEREHQNAIVSHLGLEHTAIEVKNETIFKSYLDVLWHSEKPLLRTAPVPMFLLSDEVRRNGYKVVLTGEGADELFGGYNIFKEAKCRLFWSRNPGSAMRPLLLTKLYRYVFRDRKAIRNMTSFFGRGIDHPEEPLFSHRIRWENTNRIKNFFTSDFRSSLGDYSGYEELIASLPDGFGRCDYLARAQYLEASIFLSNYLLSSQGDRMSMAHGVEIRPPFLDHRIVDLAARVPAKWKIRGLNEKYILKRAFGAILPESILKRPKHPYRAPISSSFSLAASPAVRDAMSRESLKRVGVFEPGRVGLLLKKLESPSAAGEIDDMALAGILSTQVIHDRFGRDFGIPSGHRATRRKNVDRRSARL